MSVTWPLVRIARSFDLTNYREERFTAVCCPQNREQSPSSFLKIGTIYFWNLFPKSVKDNLLHTSFNHTSSYNSSSVSSEATSEKKGATTRHPSLMTSITKRFTRNSKHGFSFFSFSNLFSKS
jgi:hypothetical protein